MRVMRVKLSSVIENELTTVCILLADSLSRDVRARSSKLGLVNVS